MSCRKTCVGSAARFQAEDYERALEDARVAVAKNKDFAKGYIRAFAALQLLDRVEEALQMASGAPEKVREDPNVKMAIAGLQQDFNDDHVLAKGRSIGRMQTTRRSSALRSS